MAAGSADGVNFINENQARRALARLLKHVAHPAGAHAHEHFHKIRAADAEKCGVRLAGDGFGEQRLARSGRSDHQHAFGNASAEALKFLGILQKLDEFRDFFNGLIHARHVLEGGFVAVLGQHAGLALAKTQRALAGCLDLPDEQEPKRQAQQQKRQDVPKQAHHHHIGRGVAGFGMRQDVSSSVVSQALCTTKNVVGTCFARLAIFFRLGR